MRCGRCGAGAGANFDPTAPRMPSDISDMQIFFDQNSNLHPSNHAEFLTQKNLVQDGVSRSGACGGLYILHVRTNSKTIVHDEFNSVKWLMICKGYYNILLNKSLP